MDLNNLQKFAQKFPENENLTLNKFVEKLNGRGFKRYAGDGWCILEVRNETIAV